MQAVRRVFVSIDSDLGGVVDKEGAVMSILGNEGRIAQAWMNVRGGFQVLAACVWHSEEWRMDTEE